MSKLQGAQLLPRADCTGSGRLPKDASTEPKAIETGEILAA
jgi:hypothetical protein